MGNLITNRKIYKGVLTCYNTMETRYFKFEKLTSEQEDLIIAGEKEE
ncbi:MAG: hypothetical protein ACP6IY_22580 [Promethearchaeia archaeon]